MEIRLHIGVHRTATQHLRKMLMLNRRLLENQGVRLLEPEYAEKAFAAAVKGMKAQEPIDTINARLMSTLTGDQEWRRIVMIDPNISGTLMRPIGKEYFYPRISTTISRIVTALEGVPMRLFIGLRNPATFVPSCYAAGLRHKPEVPFKDFISGANLQGLRWSDFLHRAQLKKADLGLTVWRYEDYPYIWRDVAQGLTGIRSREELVGTTDPVNPGISLRGAILMHQFLQENPTPTRAEFDRVSAAFDQKFPSRRAGGKALFDETHWPEDLAQGLTDNYDDDWYYIERMENVQALRREIYPD